jgi:baculoviral IAP repeat-containing protein 6
VIPVGSALKRAVDYVLCALCYVQPAFFGQLLSWAEVGCQALTDDSKEALQGPLGSHLNIKETNLMTLAVACQSPECVERLLDSGFPAVLCQALYEFCVQQIRNAGGYDGEDVLQADDSKAAASPSTGRC